MKQNKSKIKVNAHTSNTKINNQLFYILVKQPISICCAQVLKNLTLLKYVSEYINIYLKTQREICEHSYHIVCTVQYKACTVCTYMYRACTVQYIYIYYINISLHIILYIFLSIYVNYRVKYAIYVDQWKKMFQI